MKLRKVKPETFTGIYLQMREDVQRVQQENWEKLERRIGHIVLTRFMDKRRERETTQSETK